MEQKIRDLIASLEREEAYADYRQWKLKSETKKKKYFEGMRDAFSLSRDKLEKILNQNSDPKGN